MTTWAEALQRGCSVSYAVHIDGIPYIFAESRLRTVTGVEAYTPSGGGFTVPWERSAALSITEGQRIGYDCDRESGYAAGLELDILLGRQQLADEGLTSTLFARPSKRTYLTSSVTSSSTTTFSVASTSAFASSGSFYCGHEYCTYSGKTSTSFTGVTRGAGGLKHYHSSSASSGYREVTDRPVYWIGRLVTLYEHLVSPEGRYFGEYLATVGTYCREVWRGYVIETPRPEVGGMVIRCAPLVRRLAEEVGAEISGIVPKDYQGRPYIYVTDADTLGIREVSGGHSFEAWSEPNQNALGIGTIYRWTNAAEASLQAQAPANHEVSIELTSTDLNLHAFANGSHEFIFEERSSFLRRSDSRAIYERFTGVFSFAWADDDVVDCWLVVELNEDTDFTAPTPDNAGLLFVEVNGVKELMYYSDTATGDDERMRAFFISKRGLNGNRVNAWTAENATVSIVSGSYGSWKENLLTLATSSGIALERGGYDTLGFGFGLGIPETDFDTAALEFPAFDFAVGSTDTLTPGDALGGYPVVHLANIAPIVRDGECLITRVYTYPTTVTAAELGIADVLVTGHGAPEVLPGPNLLRVKTGMDGEGDTYVVRDAPRIQAEGVRALEVSMPEMDGSIRAWGSTMLAMSDGMSSLELEVPPWVQHQLGDVLDITTEHPMLYDWVSGVWAPSTVAARVVGWGRDLWSGVHRLTVLIAGQALPPTSYCPSAVVTTAVSSTEFRVTWGGAAGDRASKYFVAGDTVAIYKPGSEATQYETRTIATVTDGTSYDTITITSALSAVTAAAGIVITYPVHASSSTAQRRYMYERASYYWR